MDCSSSGIELKTLLDAIVSSEVVENRVQLFKELEELEVNEKAAAKYLVESLTILWEDFTCLDTSQCKLNKSILSVAAKYLHSDISGCLAQFLLLGTKASVWCRKHLKMTFMSSNDSQDDEHSTLFCQLLSNLFAYAAANFTVLARYAASINKEFVVSLQNFISEQFTLIEDICEVKILGSGAIKDAQSTLSAAIRLCVVYCDGVNWDICDVKKEDESASVGKETECRDNVIQIAKCIIEKLCELGTVAANNGGGLVGLLNLISLASGTLGCLAETWSSSEKEKISVAEAKRNFLPVKFYLINAVRIISQHPTCAFLAYKEIVLCVIMILIFRISLSMVEHLNSVSLGLVDVLEPTSLHLFNSLVNSPQVNLENKFQILDWLFGEGNSMYSDVECIINRNLWFLDGLFSVNSDDVTKETMLSLGRVALFINLLSCAPDHEDDLRLGIARKLGWLLDMLIEEEIYCSIFVLRIPTQYCPIQNQEMTYQPMFCALLHSLKTFMVVVSSTSAWFELESFLVENLLHPHFLCSDVVTELWCFLLRHAEPDLVKEVINKQCMVLKLASEESVHFPERSLRKTARFLCRLATLGPKFLPDQVFSTVFDDMESKNSDNLLIVLLMEGFPLNSLSENIRNMAKQSIIAQYYDFLENVEDLSSTISDSKTFGAPAFAMCATLESGQVSLCDTDMRTLKFLVAAIEKYRTTQEDAVRDNCRRILGELLGIISNVKHLYSFDEMEKVILELQNLFISKSATPDVELFACKPNLARFMAGLAHVDLGETNESARSSAAWELYHMLLRERHWAFVHLAITAFGYFAAHTTCNELWRFVPQDAALAFDLESGNKAEEDGFMSELKTVLEKEMASPSVQVSPEIVALLLKESQFLKERTRNNCKTDPNPGITAALCDRMDIDEGKNSSKKRKFPDGICVGVELLRSGLKMMGDGLCEWQQDRHETNEVEAFLTHFSRLEDAIAHLVSLAESG